MRRVHFTSVFLTTFSCSFVVWLFLAFKPVKFYSDMYPSVEILKILWLVVATILFVYTCYRYYLRLCLLFKVKKVAKGVLKLEEQDSSLLKKVFSMTKREREGSFFEIHFVLIFFLIFSLIMSFLLEGFSVLAR